ncbi:soluble lytic murein transglycosylase-like protein [Rhizomicrobium palustre]|uniref:Soluble lytic murein transglycosylase-like protein n=1 Tax=Rhizomicrobium palustre TaxID=189966 RepID=A0A846N2T7_9PROT|nr:lytic transglycosylase domain-containing protein [Rhizomicrobium palustre]NIK89829.1 soluble lytic murein transglycosylase-like protein [Rhizomicrobium palustre]
MRAEVILCFVLALNLYPAQADVFEVGDSGDFILRAGPSHQANTTRAVDKPYREASNRAAEAAQISPELLSALVSQESGWRSTAVSAKGAIGLTQLMPHTAARLGVDPHKPGDNLRGGAIYLRQQLDRFGDLSLALAAYNAGPERVAAVNSVPQIAETRAYVDRILARLAEISLPESPSPDFRLKDTP